jgi:hypothetical protein
MWGGCRDVGQRASSIAESPFAYAGATHSLPAPQMPMRPTLGRVSSSPQRGRQTVARGVSHGEARLQTRLSPEGAAVRCHWCVGLTPGAALFRPFGAGPNGHACSHGWRRGPPSIAPVGAKHGNHLRRQSGGHTPRLCAPQISGHCAFLARSGSSVLPHLWVTHGALGEGVRAPCPRRATGGRVFPRPLFASTPPPLSFAEGYLPAAGNQKPSEAQLAHGRGVGRGH